MLLEDSLFEFETKLGKGKSYALVALFVLPLIVLYYYFVVRYSVNYPFQDDYFALLNFVTSFVKSHGVLAKAGLLFVQNNEHRIVFTKAVALAQFYLCGRLDFKILKLAGNFGLLLLFCLLIKESVLKQQAPVFLAIPVAALLFNFGFWENSFWAMGSLANFWILVLAFASLYFYYQKAVCALPLSIFFALLATFSLGNGILVFFTVLVISILRKEFFTRKIFVWILSAIVTGLLFFYKYKSSNHTDILEILSFNNLITIIIYYLAFIGNFLSANIYVCCTAGVLVVLMVLYAIYKKLYATQPVLSSWVLFILFSVAVTAAGRYQHGPYQAMASRYAVNPAALFGTLFLLLGITVKSRIKVWHFLVFSFFIVLPGVYNSREALARMKNQTASFELERSLADAHQLSNFNYGWIFGDKFYPRAFLKNAAAAGVFGFSETDAQLVLNKVPQDTSQRVTFKITSVRATPNSEIIVAGYSFMPGRAPDSIHNYIYLLDSKDSLVTMLIPERIFNSHLAELPGGGKKLKNAGFLLRMNISELPPQSYHLLLVTADSRVKTIRDLHYSFEKTGAPPPS